MISRTKLSVPSLPANRLHRPRLLATIDARLKESNLLISAPVGYGKTTLAAEWAKGQNSASVWLSISKDDDQTERLMSGILAALQKRFPSIGAGTSALIQSGQAVSSETLLNPLLNELAGISQPITLILDDCHQLPRPQTYQLIATLIDNQPANFKSLLLTARNQLPLPTARWQAANKLTILNAADLQLNLTEIRQFWRAQTGVRLADEELEWVAAQTEGWLTGLQLMALADPKVMDKRAGQRLAFDYLAQEVFLKLPAKTQEFLRATAIPNSFSVELAGALLGWEVEKCRRLIFNILERNLFLFTLDEERYRYHALFLDFLRQQNENGASTRLIQRWHQRTSVYLATKGDVEGGLNHALAGKHLAEAGHLAQNLCQRAWLMGEFEQLGKWLTQLPQPIVESHPQLCLYQAWLATQTKRYHLARSWLIKAQPTFVKERELRQPSQFSALYALMQHQLRPQPDEDAQQADQLLTQSSSQDNICRALLWLTRGSCAMEMGDFETAGKALEKAALLAQERETPYLQFLSMANLIPFHLGIGNLQLAEKESRRLLRFSAKSPLGLRYQIIGKHFLGSVYLYRLDLAAASHTLKSGLQLARRLNMPGQEANFLLKRSWLEMARGDLSAAFDYGEKLVRLANQFKKAEDLSQIAEAHFALLASHQGRWEAAQNWLNNQPAGIASPSIPFSFSRNGVILSWLTINSQSGEDGARRALQQARLLQKNPRYTENARSAIDLNCLKAFAAFKLGIVEEALEWAQPALTAADRTGYCLPIAMVGREIEGLLLLAQDAGIAPALCQKLLKLVQSAGQPHPQEAAIKLTNREREIITLVAAGKTNQEISRQLHLSVNTIKSHLKRINKKLGVANRTAAVVHAQLLDLL